MSLILKIIALAIVTALISAILKKTHPEYSAMLSLAVSIIIFYFISDSIKEVFDNVRGMLSGINIEEGYILTILKIIGISYLCEYSCAMLEDAGESAVARKVEMAGKIIIFLVTIPVLKSLLELIISLL